MEYPIKKDDQIVIVIESYTAEGAGVGRYEGLAVFVPQTICGETVRVHILKIAARYAVGKCVEILHPSPHRVKPPCPVYRQCGGCVLQHMDARAQEALKRRRIADCFSHIGGFEQLPAPIVHTMEQPLRYRNKASFPVRLQQGKAEIGLYAQRSHRIVPVTDCLLQHSDNAKILTCVSMWMQQSHVKAYDEQTGQGSLRHVLTRRATNGDWLVCLVHHPFVKRPGADRFAAHSRATVKNRRRKLQHCTHECHFRPARTCSVWGWHTARTAAGIDLLRQRAVIFTG